jgi:agmatinase
MLSKEELIASFDPNAPGANGNLFGLPFTPETSSLVLIPVPWEVTVSYHAGTAKGPQAILEASTQVDLSVKEIPNAWQLGVSMLPVPKDLLEESTKLRELASQHIKAVEAGEKVMAGNPIVAQINEASENLNIYVKSTALKWLKESKMVGLVGGDHSTPLGLLRALGEVHDRFGILQIDAHADLRKAYEGFTYSHASVMFNALKIPAVQRLVQVGIRDYCDEELQVMERAMGRVVTFFDQTIKSTIYDGKTWGNICDSIIKELPQNVYISFDIDGLDPVLCPNTGTPVPGGLQFDQVTYLLRKLAKSGKRIIGFDLNEVAPSLSSDWDANVGARLLYQLCNWMAVSQGKLKAVGS